MELWTTSFIESTGVACSDSVSHNRVRVLSIPELLLACSEDWNVEITIKMKTIVQKPLMIKNQQASSQKFRQLIFSWSVLLHPSYSSGFAPSDFHQVKMFAEIFLRLNFTWEESTSYLINGKRWFKIIVNILSIEIYSLLNNSWMNYILL